MHLLHHRTSLFMKSVHLEASIAYQSSLQATVSKQVFLESCNEFHGSVDVVSCGLEAPLRKKMNVLKARAFAEKLYAEIFEDATAIMKRALDQRQREQDQKDQAQKDLLAAQPEVLLQDLVRDFVDEAMNKDVKMGDGGEKARKEKDEVSSPENERARAFVDALRARSNGRSHTKGGKGKGPPEPKPHKKDSKKGKGKGGKEGSNGSNGGGSKKKRSRKKGFADEITTSPASSKGSGKGYSRKGSKNWESPTKVGVKSNNQGGAWNPRALGNWAASKNTW